MAIGEQVGVGIVGAGAHSVQKRARVDKVLLCRGRPAVPQPCRPLQARAEPLRAAAAVQAVISLSRLSSDPLELFKQCSP